MSADNRMLPGEFSLAYNLLSLTAISGELPTALTSRLSGGVRYKRKLLDALKAQGLLRTYYRDGLRGLRLTKKAKTLLLEDNAGRFSFFVEGGADTNRLKSEVVRRARLHRVSETYIAMQNANVAIFRDEKPDLFYPDGASQPPPFLDLPSFYSSREVKELGDASVRIRGSRSTGVLLTEANIHLVYNTGSALMKWDRNSELRLKTLMRVVLCQERLPNQYRPEHIHGLALGIGMEPAYKMLTSTGGEKRRFFMLGEDFEHFRYLPADHRGETILRILCDAHLKEQLHLALSNGFEARDLSKSIEHDAQSERGELVLFAYDFDLPRIARFNAAIHLQSRMGIALCFDFQADVLRRYCGDLVQLRLISFDKMERRFFASREENS